jgi:hypothetical protein
MQAVEKASCTLYSEQSVFRIRIRRILIFLPFGPLGTGSVIYLYGMQHPYVYVHCTVYTVPVHSVPIRGILVRIRLRIRILGSVP